MRIAVLIIGLCLTLIVGLQSCVVGVGGSLRNDQGLTDGAGVGLVIACLFVLGSASVIAYPRVSVGLFLVTGMLAVGVADQTPFSDLKIWGIVSLVLSAMSYLGSRELRQKSSLAKPMF